MKYLDYAGLQLYDALIKQYIQDNIPDSSQAADVATALKNAYNTNATIKVAVCTQAEYNALQNPESNVLYIISDETSEVVNVEANPTGTATTVLTKIKISNVIYSIPQIEANPTLDGTETTLTGLGINGVNYAIPSGGGGEAHLYEHRLFIRNYSTGDMVIFKAISKSAQPWTSTSIPEAETTIFSNDINRSNFENTSYLYVLISMVNLSSSFTWQQSPIMICMKYSDNSIVSLDYYDMSSRQLVDTVTQIF